MREGVLNVETGEIHPNERPFAKVYFERLNQAKLKGKEYQILFFLIELMDDRNVVGINKSMKQRFSNEKETSVATIDNTISSLVKKGVIKRIATGLYVVNPEYASKAEYSKVINISF